MLPLILSAALLGLLACERGPATPEVHGPEALREQIADLYERARESGEEISSDVYEWAREDVEGIGDWEYRVVRLKGSDEPALQAELNALGAERWEVVWLERNGPVLRLYLKRPKRSYLRHLPLSELPRLIPGVGE